MAADGGSFACRRLRADAEIMREWTEQLAREFEDKALPFFSSTDSPEKAAD
ncbi:MAG: hypothetical protein V8S72_07695 [Oscillospiraceae bacterium]